MKIDLQSSLQTFETKAANLMTPKLEYSWNKKVDKQELGIRPDEIEIMSGDLPLM